MPAFGGLGRNFGHMGLVGSRGFDPSKLSQLAFWLDPSNSGSVTLNVSDVSQINDLSANARNASQGTSANQPAYTSAGINGRNTVTFTAANNDALSMASALSMTQNITGFCFWGVLKVANLAAANRIFTVLGGGGNARFDIQAAITTGKLTIITRRLDADSNVTTTAASAALAAGTAAFGVFQVDYTNGAYLLQVGATRETGSIVWVGGNGSTDNTASSTAPLFGRTGASVYGGDMAEVGGYTRALTTIELDQLRTYCTAKWGTA